MTLFILPLVKSLDVRGKSVLFKHRQAFAICFTTGTELFAVTCSVSVD